MVRIIAVGITDAINETQLRNMVSNADTDFFRVENFFALTGLISSIIDSVRRDFST